MPYSLHLEPAVYSRGDSRPPLYARIVDDTGDGLDLSDSRRRTLRLFGGEPEPVVETRADIADREEDGWLVVNWGRDELDIPARIYWVSVEVRFSDRGQITAPTESDATLRITE